MLRPGQNEEHEIQIGYVIEPYRSHQKLKVKLNLELEPATLLGSTPCRARTGQDGGLFSLESSEPRVLFNSITTNDILLVFDERRNVQLLDQ